MTRVTSSVRDQVRQRAKFRCEYCYKPEDANAFSHQVDHIIPEKHLGTSALSNLAWACFRCNNAKSTDIASYDADTGALTPLYNPRTQNWGEHFMTDENAVIAGLTAIGRVTVRIPDMNRPRQIQIRQALIDAGLW
jgi:hypothetical protein